MWGAFLFPPRPGGYPARYRWAGDILSDLMAERYPSRSRHPDGTTTPVARAPLIHSRHAGSTHPCPTRGQHPSVPPRGQPQSAPDTRATPICTRYAGNTRPCPPRRHPPSVPDLPSPPTAPATRMAARPPSPPGPRPSRSRHPGAMPAMRPGLTIRIPACRPLTLPGFGTSFAPCFRSVITTRPAARPMSPGG